MLRGDAGADAQARDRTQCSNHGKEFDRLTPGANDNETRYRNFALADLFKDALVDCGEWPTCALHALASAGRRFRDQR